MYFSLFRSFRWFRSHRFARFGGFVSAVSVVSVVSVVSFRWFRFGVSGFSTCRVLTGVIRRSEPFGANDTCNHLYLFLRSLQKQLLDFSSVRLQFIYCPYKLAKTSEDSKEST